MTGIINAREKEKGKRSKTGMFILFSLFMQRMVSITRVKQAKWFSVHVFVNVPNERARKIIEYFETVSFVVALNSSVQVLMQKPRNILTLMYLEFLYTLYSESRNFSLAILYREGYNSPYVDFALIWTYNFLRMLLLTPCWSINSNSWGFQPLPPSLLLL